MSESNPIRPAGAARLPQEGPALPGAVKGQGPQVPHAEPAPVPEAEFVGATSTAPASSVEPAPVAATLQGPPQVGRVGIPPEALDRLVEQYQEIPGARIYHDLGDVYDRDERGRFQKSSEPQNQGLHNWEDFVAFTFRALQNAPEGTSLHLELQVHDFPDLDLPQTTLQTLQRQLQNCGKENMSLSVAVQGDPMDPPILYKLTSTSQNRFANGEKEWLNISDKALFWGDRNLTRQAKDRLRTNMNHLFLLQALEKVHKESPQAPRGEFLDQVLEVYNKDCVQRPAFGAQPIGLDAQGNLVRRTEIFGRLDSLSRFLKRAALEIVQEQGLEIQPHSLAWDPLFDIVFNPDHQATQDPKNHFVLIGGGAMSSMAEFIRTQMDLGRLPLDTRLTIVDMQDQIIWEGNQTGTNPRFDAGYFINAQGEEGSFIRKKVHFVPHRLRNDYLEHHPAANFIFALKAAYVAGAVMDDFLIAHMKQHHAVILSPSKGADRGNNTYEKVSTELHLAGAPELAHRLAWVSGFFSSNDILDHNRAKLSMAVASNSEEANEQIKRMFPDEMVPMEYYVSREIAAMGAVAGHAKNYLTYSLARDFMKRVLELSDEEATHLKTRFELEGDLDQAVQQNIRDAEEIAARTVGLYSQDPTFSTARYRLPEPIQADIIYCAPQNLSSLFAMRRRLHLILQSSDSTTASTALKQLIDEIVASRIATTNEYGESIHISRGGTRNAGDGYIDSLLVHTFDLFKAKGWIANDTTLEEFHQEFYPKKWTGPGTLEGRLMNDFNAVVEEAGITLVDGYYRALGRYQLLDENEIETSLQSKQPQQRAYEEPTSQDLTTRFGVDIQELVTWGSRTEDVTWALTATEMHPGWGLPQGWVARFTKYLNFLVGRFNDASIFGRSRIEAEQVQTRFKTLLKILSPLQETDGAYAIITQRLIELRTRIEALQTIMSTLPQGSLVQSNRNSPLNRFKDLLIEELRIGKAHFDNPRDVERTLLKMIQDLYEIELSMHQIVQEGGQLRDGSPVFSHARLSAVSSHTSPADTSSTAIPASPGLGEPKASLDSWGGDFPQRKGSLALDQEPSSWTTPQTPLSLVTPEVSELDLSAESLSLHQGNINTTTSSSSALGQHPTFITNAPSLGTLGNASIMTPSLIVSAQTFWAAPISSFNTPSSSLTTTRSSLALPVSR